MAISIFLMIFVILAAALISLFFIKSAQIKTAVISALIFLFFAAATAFWSASVF